MELQTLGKKSLVTGIWLTTGEEGFGAEGMQKPDFLSHFVLIIFDSKSDPILDEATMTCREFRRIAQRQSSLDRTEAKPSNPTGPVHTLLYLTWGTNKVLLYSTGNSGQWYLAAWMGGELGGEWIHVYGWLSPFTFIWNNHIADWL